MTNFPAPAVSLRLRDLVRMLKDELHELRSQHKPGVSELSGELRLDLIDLKEKNIMLSEQVKTLTGKLSDAKMVSHFLHLTVALPQLTRNPLTRTRLQLLSEQDAVIKQSNTVSQQSSANVSTVQALDTTFRDQIHALHEEISRLKDEHNKVEQRYRHEKLLMLKAWNDLGQRTMKAQEGSIRGSSSAGWLRSQRQSLNAGQ